ncbi:LytTR family DNA-binding domain-containing protein [uncultured Psychroserpens sp.]|uniref:LytR/AlgR family response regulator transcription factor n=1 Tax=uncultured Psychroserpens sp. TaxID=255436 RepID=UPI002614D373|nr:LytTR family DNA-binding domain-containing protein [uncultured Psychroserpens sp.]
MLNTIIIDDEPNAINLLKDYSSNIGKINLMASFRNAIDGMNFIESNVVDLVLLDINMPKLSGISLAKLINTKVGVIFTTAYSEYAVVSYKLNAIDYLLKPIDFDRFIEAINKADNIINSAHSNDTIIIKSGYKIFQVHLNDILYLEKEGNYITYHLKGKSILVRENVGTTLDSLPNYFKQIHKSYIVPLSKIEIIEQNHVLIGSKKIPIGRSYKNEIDRFFKSDF